MTEANQKLSLESHRQEVEELIHRIVGSDSFGKSATHANLLQFLVESTLSGEVPKEVAVATHLFGQEKALQDTSQVRVHIYHVRKKLEQYFDNEGKGESYLLTIPKGRYEVELTPRTTTNQRKLKTSNPKVWLFAVLGLLGVSLLLNLYLLLTTDREAEAIPNPFWEDYITDDRPTLVVLGDLLVFSERNKITGEVRTIRMADINDANLLPEYLDSFPQPDREFEQLSYTYLIKSSVAWIESLTRVFHGRKEFSTRVLSRMDTQDLHDYNIVFIGMQKTAGLFNTYFDDSELHFFGEGNRGYGLSIEGQSREFGPSGDPDQQHKDYGVIAKYPGPNNNIIFMFGGIWDTAASQAFKTFTDETESQRMEALMTEQFGTIPRYFEVLIEVAGVDRVGFETEVTYMREISD